MSFHGILVKNEFGTDLLHFEVNGQMKWMLWGYEFSRDFKNEFGTDLLHCHHILLQYA